MKLSFYKEESGEWYVDLPDYPGPKEDLQMVYGADTMLDMISEGEDWVSIEIASHAVFNDEFYMLRALTIPPQFDIGGKWYSLDYRGKMYVVWLCDVTTHVFGDFPEIIQFKVL
jgi:hypothetical protein